MKKIHLILCAGVLALAAISCGRDVQPAKPMSAPEVKQKLVTTATDVLKEVDPDNWKDWGQTGLKLIGALQQVEEGNMESLGEDLEAAMESIVTNDKQTIITTLIRLSLLKGDIVVEDNAFKYTKSNKQLNLTYEFEGKTYKAQLESSGESGDGIVVRERMYEEFQNDQLVSSETRITKLVVPAKAAIHVTENGKLFLDAVVNPEVEDKNKNGYLDENDVVKGSAVIQIPGYELTLDDLSVSDEGATAAVELTHGNKAVLSVDAEVEMDLFIEQVKAVTVNSRPDDISGTVKLMDGTAIIKADVDLQDLLGAEMYYATKEEAEKVAAVFAKNAKMDLYFDNNPTIQASLCFLVEQHESSWEITPGMHLYDGSADVPVDVFFDMTDEVWKPLNDDATSFLGKLTLYFHDLLPKHVTDSML